MEHIEVFGPKLSALIALAAVAYLLLAFAPVLWPAYRAFRSKTRLPRPWLFVGSVAALVYGVFTFLAFALLLPIEIYGIFVAPSLEAADLSYGAPVLGASGFLAQYSWLAIPPAQLLMTWFVTHKLGRRWERICAALAA